MEERGVEAETGGEHEGSAMIAVVAQEKVGHGRLGAGGSQRGMGVDDGGRRIEAWVGDAPYAHLVVVVGDVLEQELDGVVGVGCVVDVLGGFLVVDVGAHLDKIALAHPAATHVLVDKDVAAFFKLIRGAKVLWILILAVRGDAIGGPVHQERVRTASGILGHIDRGEQVLAVAHGNAELVLGVVGADVILGRRKASWLLGLGGAEWKSK